MNKMYRVLIVLFAASFLFSAMAFAQLGDLKKALDKFKKGEDTKDRDRPEVVNVIDWKKLSPLLPESIDGYEAGDLDGGTLSMADPMGGGQSKYSSVTRTFTSGKKRILITIVDTGYKDMLMAPYNYAIEFDGPDGSMKNLDINGFTSKEMVKMNNGEYIDAQLMTLIHDRVLVVHEAKGGAQLEEIYTEAKKFKYDTLEKLAKESEKSTPAVEKAAE